MSDLNVFEQSKFNPHRASVTGSADSAAPLAIAKTKGINGLGYDRAFLDVKKTAGTFTTVVLQILFWSEASAAFVPQFPNVTFTLTQPGQVGFGIDGKTFYARVNTLTGAALNIAIGAMAAAPHESLAA